MVGGPRYVPEGPVRAPAGPVCGWADCGTTLEGRRPGTKFCSATCRNRAARDRAARGAQAKAEQAAAAGAEHTLVTAVRSELEAAAVLDTVDGQIALQLARRAVEANAAGVSGLMRELRTTIAAAQSSAPTPAPDPTPAPTEPPTTLDAARRRREQKAREAADRT